MHICICILYINAQIHIYVYTKYINANSYYAGPEFWVVRFKRMIYKSYIRCD